MEKRKKKITTRELCCQSDQEDSSTTGLELAVERRKVSSCRCA